VGKRKAVKALWIAFVKAGKQFFSYLFGLTNILYLWFECW